MALSGPASRTRRSRLSLTGRVALALALAEAATAFASMFRLALSTTWYGLTTHKPWLLPALYETGLGVVFAAIAAAPLIYLILWADIWTVPRSSEAVGVALGGTVAHVAFSLWLLLGMMFPPEFRGADLTPVPLTFGQGVLIGMTWLVIILIRASDRSAPGRTS